MAKHLSSMPKNLSNSVMKLLRRPKLDFHMPLLFCKCKTQFPGKVLELLSHQSHQSQDSLPPPLPLLVTLTRRDLMAKHLSSMPKNPSNSETMLPRRPKLDFLMLLHSSNLRIQFPGKVLEFLSHQSHQFQDSLPLPLPLLVTLTRRELMANLLSSMPKNPSNSETMPPIRPKLDSHTLLPYSK